MCQTCIAIHEEASIHYMESGAYKEPFSDDHIFGQVAKRGFEAWEDLCEEGQKEALFAADEACVKVPEGLALPT